MSSPDDRAFGGVVMGATNVERLRIVEASARPSGPWSGTDLARVMTRAADVAGVSGSLLPATVVYRRTVVPVVSWDLNVLAYRLRRGPGPILERHALRGLLPDTVDAPPPACPVAVQAYLCALPLAQARGDLTVLSIYAPVIWVTPNPPGAAALERLECDLDGYTVVQVGPDTAEVLVRGHEGPDPSCRPVSVQDRLYREQLFDIAARSGLLPPI